eukprot:5784989-Amphidinium_carterae.1
MSKAVRSALFLHSFEVWGSVPGRVVRKARPLERWCCWHVSPFPKQQTVRGFDHGELTPKQSRSKRHLCRNTGRKLKSLIGKLIFGRYVLGNLTR